MSNAAEVMWTPERTEKGAPLRLQHWKEGRPKDAPVLPMAIERAAPDAFKLERSGIIERLSSALHPSAHWRDPREAGGVMRINSDATPFSARAAEAVVWLRKHPESHEVRAAADALWCIIVQDHCAVELLRVATALAREWRKHVPTVRRMAWDSSELGETEYAAGLIAIRCATGVVTRDKPKVSPQLWGRLQEQGVRIVWDWADTAASRAAKAFR